VRLDFVQPSKDILNHTVDNHAHQSLDSCGRVLPCCVWLRHRPRAHLSSSSAERRNGSLSVACRYGFSEWRQCLPRSPRSIRMWPLRSFSTAIRTTALRPRTSGWPLILKRRWTSDTPTLRSEPIAQPLLPLFAAWSSTQVATFAWCAGSIHFWTTRSTSRRLL